MKINTYKITDKKKERIDIFYEEMRADTIEIIDFIKSKDLTISAYEADGSCQIPLKDIFYIEAVDNKIFAYLESKVYEIKMKLYEFENLFNPYRFFRCSKSCIINLMKIDTIKPALNSRFTANLKNGEKVIISRQYVSQLKKVLGGE